MEILTILGKPDIDQLSRNGNASVLVEDDCCFLNNLAGFFKQSLWDQSIAKCNEKIRIDYYT